MQVKVRLFGVFRINHFKEEVRELSPGCTAQDVVDALRLPSQLLGIVLINDLHAQLDDTLSEGDTLALLPLLDGG
jgi:molybdopterin converting factor small subunit